MDLAPLAVMRVTRDAINNLPEQQRQQIQQRAEEIAQQRQAQPAPEPGVPAAQPAQVPEVAPAPAPEPAPAPQPAEQAVRAFNSVTLGHGRIWVGRMVVDPQTGPVMVRRIIGRRGIYSFEVQGNRERRPRTVNQATMDNWILAEQPQAGQPAAQPAAPAEA